MKSLFIALQRLLPHHLLSRCVGAIAGARLGPLKNVLIRIFVAAYKVNLDEAASGNLADYPTFNDFFTRQLKPGARPVEGGICSPADGTVSMAGTIEGTRMIQAKGIDYSLGKLLATDPGPWQDGSFATIYLAPRDYHRVHMPIDGRLTKTRYVPGRLFSVNQTTAERVPDLFADNERLVLEFETDDGPFAMVLVGAMIVAGIRTVWRSEIYPFRLPTEERFDPPRAFGQGDELGWFEMGSTVIVVMPGRTDWQVEPMASVRMGQALATTGAR